MFHKKLLYLLFSFLNLFFSPAYSSTRHAKTHQKTNTTVYTAQAPIEERVAYHESGHALIACLLNTKITKMTIIPTFENYGCVEFIPPTREKALQIFLGGYLAEKIIFGEEQKYLSNADLSKSKKIAQELSKRNLPFFYQKRAENILKYYQEQTAKMIINNMPALHALAKKIKQEKLLNGEQVYQIINKIKKNQKQYSPNLSIAPNQSITAFS